jgi:Sec-independent protein secretion pathway component TatC
MKLLSGKLPDDPNEVRMTIGEHLDELRGVVIRSLIALVVVGLACIWPMKYLLGLIARPLLLAQEKHHQPMSFLATDPAEGLLVYVKVVMISALIIASPYVIYQIWTYVATGLYRYERAWVQKLVPFSVGLFVVGVLFMYFLMLPICLDFLIGFSSWLPMPELTPLPWEQALLVHSAPATQPTATQPTIPPVPLLSHDPASPGTGEMWFNLDQAKLKLHGVDQTYSWQFQMEGHSPLITSHIKLSDYLWFVLLLTIAFGLAFQMPLVVVFLARSGIMPIATLRKYRKGAILTIVIIAGMIAPPDLMSHLLLSGPMILLFELGLWIAARGERAKKSAPPT